MRPSMPLGRSTATTGSAGAVDRVDGLRGAARHRPVEAGAEQRIDDDVGAVDDAGRRGPCSARSTPRPRRPHRPSAGRAAPAARRSRRSPPPPGGAPRRSRRRHCCRGRSSPDTRPPCGSRSWTASATASPAASISIDARRPPAMVSAVGLAHLLRGQHFERVVDQGHLAARSGASGTSPATRRSNCEAHCMSIDAFLVNCLIP